MRRTLSAPSAAVIAIALGIGWATPAQAGLSAGGKLDNDSIEARVDRTAETEGGIPVKADQDAPVCTTARVDPAIEGLYRIDSNRQLVALFDAAHPEDGGNWYRETCRRNGSISTKRMYWVVSASATDLAKQALGSAQLPAPTIAITPTPPAISYVNMPLWLWIDRAAWTPVKATASADGLTVTVTAAPAQVTWDSGDPDVPANERTKTCYHPGKVFNPNFSASLQYSDCTYTYLNTSGKQPGLAFPLTATLQWRATWNASNGTNGDLGFVGRSSTIPIKVGEIQALNVRPEGLRK